MGPRSDLIRAARVPRLDLTLAGGSICGSSGGLCHRQAAQFDAVCDGIFFPLARGLSRRGGREASPLNAPVVRRDNASRADTSRQPAGGEGILHRVLSDAELVTRASARDAEVLMRRLGSRSPL